tara:strand:+ start:120 stop:680 length:561 start_codon:yes stop_codon:yes gene_type:complete
MGKKMPILNPNATVDVTNTGTSSGLTNTNFLQPTAFNLSIDRKNFANLQFFCQAVLHPALNMNSVEVPYKRISSIPFAGDKLTFTELTCIIIVDENLNSYTEMYNWMTRIVENNEVRALDRTSELPPTYCDMTINILSSHNNVTRKIKYLDCIPTSLGDMTLESPSGDLQYITFPATFRFSTFELS